MVVWLWLAALALGAGWLYNMLISRKNGVDNAFGGIDAMLAKRHDLIPNLVATVQGYMQHERDLLERLTQLRARALEASGESVIHLDKQVTRQIRGVLLAAEDYPDLQASENFLYLQASLHDLEEQIAAARRAYNAAVTDYNNAVEMIPTNLVAGVFGFKRKALFELTPDARENVDVRTMLRR